MFSRRMHLFSIAASQLLCFKHTNQIWVVSLIADWDQLLNCYFSRLVCLQLCGPGGDGEKWMEDDTARP